MTFIAYSGVMLSVLLARADVVVTLLEAHKDFDRDFRGDTIQRQRWTWSTRWARGWFTD